MRCDLQGLRDAMKLALKYMAHSCEILADFDMRSEGSAWLTGLDGPLTLKGLLGY